MSEMTPAQSALLDQLSAQVEHFVNGARLAKAARDHGNEAVAELIAKVMSVELNQLDADDLRGLVMTSTSMFAEHLNHEQGHPKPDKSLEEIEDFATTMDDTGMGAIVLAVDNDGNLIVPDGLPEPIVRVMKEVIQRFKDDD